MVHTNSFSEAGEVDRRMGAKSVEESRRVVVQRQDARSLL